MKSKIIAAAMLLLLTSVAGADVDVETQTACSPLFAGQHTLVGTVCIKVNADDVDMHYLLIDDWVLTEAHAWIGDNLNNMPQNSGGNPKIGLFPHAVSGLSGVADYSFRIPVSELAVTAETFCSAEIFVAAHAVVERRAADGTADVAANGDDDDEGDKKSSRSSKKSGKDQPAKKSSDSGKGNSGPGGDGDSRESAWAGTMSMAGGSWATYFSFMNECDAPEEPIDPNWWLPALDQPGCNHVFANGGQSFFEEGLAAQGSIGWVLAQAAAGGTTDYPLTDGVNDYGDVRITPMPGQKMAIGFFLTDDRVLGAVNIFIGDKGSFSVINPQMYPYQFSGSGGKIVTHSATGADLDIVIHAVACEKGITPPA